MEENEEDNRRAAVEPGAATAAAVKAAAAAHGRAQQASNYRILLHVLCIAYTCTLEDQGKTKITKKLRGTEGKKGVM